MAAPSQSGEMPCEFAHQIVSQGVAGMTLCREYVRPLDQLLSQHSRRVPQYWYCGTSGTVFTRPILSGYLTKINETRIVKLR